MWPGLSRVDSSLEAVMTMNDMMKQLLQLEPARRFDLVEKIPRSLDQPAAEIEQKWPEED